mmetsp:Transcript_43829/g.92157  ORF Transcript_43829/g.92157 Transcript_43829/m.92157 type:complete len:84 (+) Transcript_43829:436-687(+)
MHHRLHILGSQHPNVEHAKSLFNFFHYLSKPLRIPSSVLFFLRPMQTQHIILLVQIFPPASSTKFFTSIKKSSSKIYDSLPHS